MANEGALRRGVFLLGGDDGIKAVGEVEAQMLASDAHHALGAGNVAEATAKNVFEQNNRCRRRRQADIFQGKLLGLHGGLRKAVF